MNFVFKLILVKLIEMNSSSTTFRITLNNIFNVNPKLEDFSCTLDCPTFDSLEIKDGNIAITGDSGNYNHGDFSLQYFRAGF